MTIYEKPMLEISELESSDVITLSVGDTEYDDVEW